MTFPTVEGLRVEKTGLLQSVRPSYGLGRITYEVRTNSAPPITWVSAALLGV